MRVAVVTCNNHTAELAALTAWLADERLAVTALTHVPVEYPMTTVRAIEGRMSEFDLVVVRNILTAEVNTGELLRILTAAEEAGTRFACPLEDPDRPRIDTAGDTYAALKQALTDYVRAQRQYQALRAQVAREYRAARAQVAGD